MVATIMMVITSCHESEPDMPGRKIDPDIPTDTINNDTIQPHDTVPPDTIPRDTISNDTTHNSTVFTIQIVAPRDYAYMGQTLQLSATTSDTATVTWKSTDTRVATIDQQGLITVNNNSQDCQTAIIARANGVSDTLIFNARHWAVAASNGSKWETPAYLAVHPGDTVTVTIVDSALQPVDLDGFNAGSCTWTASSRQADIEHVIASSIAPSQGNGWLARYVIAATSPTAITFQIKASYNSAASSMSCTVVP